MNNSSEIYPWQDGAWEHLNQFNTDREQRLAHALLLHGREGIGKYVFARSFSQAILCLNKDAAKACGKCSSCNWFNDDSHPDFRLLSPELELVAEDEAPPAKKTKKKTQISVAQIRDLSNFLNLSSHRSNGFRVVLIHPAESLNLASANALLKMLEEPASGVIFILITHQLQRLLPTIISRCQKINMPTPSEREALVWLDEQGVHNAPQQLAYMQGSPLKVLEEQEHFKHLSEVWRALALGNKLEAHIVAPLLITISVEIGVITIQKWLYDIVAVKLGQQTRYHLQYTNALQALAGKVNLSQLFDLQKKTNEQRKLVRHPLNHELQMESLLLEYTKLF